MRADRIQILTWLFFIVSYIQCHLGIVVGPLGDAGTPKAQCSSCEVRRPPHSFLVPSLHLFFWCLLCMFVDCSNKLVFFFFLNSADYYLRVGTGPGSFKGIFYWFSNCVVEGTAEWHLRAGKPLPPQPLLPQPGWAGAHMACVDSSVSISLPP